MSLRIIRGMVCILQDCLTGLCFVMNDVIDIIKIVNRWSTLFFTFPSLYPSVFILHYGGWMVVHGKCNGFNIMLILALHSLSHTHSCRYSFPSCSISPPPFLRLWDNKNQQKTANSGWVWWTIAGSIDSNRVYHTGISWCCELWLEGILFLFS